MVNLKTVILLVAATVIGCGSRPHPSVQPEDEVQILIPEKPGYRIAVEDVLSVRFFYYPSYNVDVIVRPDGVVTIPLVGEVKVEGMAPSELEQIIRERYAEILVEPEVSVIVTQFAQRRIFVFGEVKLPGAIAYSGMMTIVDAIANAGGHLPTANLANVVLMRRQENGSYVGRKIDVQKMLESETPDMVYVMPQDIVYVPMTAISKVNMFVNQFFERITPAWLFIIYGREAVEKTGEVIVR